MSDLLDGIMVECAEEGWGRPYPFACGGLIGIISGLMSDDEGMRALTVDRVHELEGKGRATRKAAA